MNLRGLLEYAEIEAKIRCRNRQGLVIQEGTNVSILDCQLLHCVCGLLGVKAELVPAVGNVTIHEFKMHEE